MSKVLYNILNQSLRYAETKSNILFGDYGDSSLFLKRQLLTSIEGLDALILNTSFFYLFSILLSFF